MVSGFLIGSDRDKQRRLRKAGALVVTGCIAAVLIAVYVVRPLIPRDGSLMAVTIDTSSVGPGVEEGTDVMLHGVSVGKVSGLHVNLDGTSSVTVDLNEHAVRGMGRDFVVDFRPKNYFGITGVNIADPGSTGAGELRDGDHVTRHDAADYTMATMIEQGSGVVNGTLLPETMDAIKRVLTYTAAFEPLIHTGVVFADVVARTQREMPAYLMDRFNEILAGLPPFADGAMSALASFYDSALRPAGDDVQNNFTLTLKAISDNFFSMVGRLLKSNEGDLTPLVNTATAAAGVLPAIEQTGVTSTTLRELLTHLDGAFEDGPDGRQILKIELALQRLPGLAGPLVGLPNGAP